MSFWSRLKEKIAERYEDWDDEWEPYEETDASQLIERDWDQIAYLRSHTDIHDHKQRHDYVVSCLEQIADASNEIETLNYEYNMVTSYLKDMEEIEALPAEEKANLQAVAARVSAIRRDKMSDEKKTIYMSDEKFAQFSMINGDVEEGIQKLTEAENYRSLIKSDLRKLDNEHSAYRYRRSELIGTLENCQGMGVIVTVAVVVCLLALLVMQYGMRMNASWGYILTASVATIIYVGLFLKNKEAAHELKRVESETNRLILLQNKVKIRYVNNTTLIDYLCMKYNVDSAKELAKLWNQYNEEKRRRAEFRKAQLELDEYETKLLHILRRFQIADPAVWLNQTDALLDKKEMVEIRHNLIVRRQSLRKRMDYNREVIAQKAQNELRNLVESYPRYASEILALVEEYDARSNAEIS